MNELIGKTILGIYRVDAFLGKGGNAEVYKVWDQKRSVHLAMKILHEDLAEDKVFLRRFRREAQTLAELQHPNIVRFYGLEHDHDLVFMLMEYVEGTTLRKEIFKSNEPFSLQRIAEIVYPVCAALHYAHQSGFIHCDIKPANIMLHRNGTVLVADFGIARMAEAATMTMVGAGTPAYMSPEQARGENPIAPTDIYALGIVLFEMLTGGERPFTGEHAGLTGSTSERVRWEQMHAAPPSPKKYNANIPSNLASLVLKCMEKDPKKRYQSISDMLIAFNEAIAVTRENTPSPKNNFEEAREPGPNSGLKGNLNRNDLPKQKGLPAKLQTMWESLWLVGQKSLVSFRSLWLEQTKSLGNSRSVQKRKFVLSNTRLLKWLLTFILLFGFGSMLFFSGVFRSSPVSNTGVLYFTSNRENNVDIYKLMGSKVVQVTDSHSKSWSPILSSTGVLYFTSNRTGKAEIYKLDGSKVVQVTNSKTGASWSPTLSNTGILYFTSNRSGKAEIYKLIGSHAVQVTNTQKGQSWSPTLSNTGILYFTSNRSGRAEIYKLIGSHVVQVTNTRKGESWSPVLSNTGILYFSSNRNGKVQIYKLNGPNVVQVTNTKTGENWSPVLSKSGILYFTSNRSEKTEIYKLIGSNVVKVTNTKNGESWGSSQTKRGWIPNANSWRPSLISAFLWVIDEFE